MTISTLILSLLLPTRFNAPVFISYLQGLFWKYRGRSKYSRQLFYIFWSAAVSSWSYDFYSPVSSHPSHFHSCVFIISKVDYMSLPKYNGPLNLIANICKYSMNNIYPGSIMVPRLSNHMSASILIQDLFSIASTVFLSGLAIVKPLHVITLILMLVLTCSTSS